MHVLKKKSLSLWHGSIQVNVSLHVTNFCVTKKDQKKRKEQTPGQNSFQKMAWLCQHGVYHSSYVTASPSRVQQAETVCDRVDVEPLSYNGSS